MELKINQKATKTSIGAQRCGPGAGLHAVWGSVLAESQESETTIQDSCPIRIRHCPLLSLDTAASHATAGAANEERGHTQGTPAQWNISDTPARCSANRASAPATNDGERQCWRRHRAEVAARAGFARASAILSVQSFSTGIGRSVQDTKRLKMECKTLKRAETKGRRRRKRAGTERQCAQHACCPAILAPYCWGAKTVSAPRQRNLLGLKRLFSRTSSNQLVSCTAPTLRSIPCGCR